MCELAIETAAAAVSAAKDHALFCEHEHDHDHDLGHDHGAADVRSCCGALRAATVVHSNGSSIAAGGGDGKCAWAELELHTAASDIPDADIAYKQMM